MIGKLLLAADVVRVGVSAAKWVRKRNATTSVEPPVVPTAVLSTPARRFFQRLKPEPAPMPKVMATVREVAPAPQPKSSKAGLICFVGGIAALLGVAAFSSRPPEPAPQREPLPMMPAQPFVAEQSLLPPARHTTSSEPVRSGPGYVHPEDHTGPRGGRFHYSKSGKKVYHH